MESSSVYLWGGVGLGIGLLVGALFMVACYQLFLVKRIVARVEKEGRERKDQFTALASHYMFNPITIIQTAIITLQEKSNNIEVEERERLYEIILRGQQRLWILAEQLLLVGQIDQGELKLHLGVVNIGNTISSALSAVDIFARAKQVNLRFDDISSDIQEARLDPRLLKQALIAVLDNAIKFSLERGTVVVSLKYEQGIITILVQDNGIGMTPEVSQHISEKFFRGTKLYDFDYEGLGLGLHVALAIIRLHSGNITFNSKIDKGTAVAIQFPNL